MRNLVGSALAFPLALALLNGCQSPELAYVKPVQDSPQHIQQVEATIESAKAKRVWTLEDEHTFSRNMAHMTLETRFALAKKIATAINKKEMQIGPTRSKTPAPPFCPCTPGLCDAATPAPVTTAPLTGAQQPPARPASETQSRAK